MLSTIADLLTDRAKVVLTSRKTAIFSGASFADWYADQKEKHSSFKLIRYQLDSPTVEQWLPKERRQNLPFQNPDSLANPVLLSYLRYCDYSSFCKSVKSPDELINSFFSFILSREMERQNLSLSPTEQRRIFRRLACIFGGYGITADSRAHVKEQIEEIAYDDIAKNLKPSQDVESVTNSLTNHALLDRKGFSNVGFINDFIFGLLLKDSIVKDRDIPIFHTFHQSTPNSYLAKSTWASSILEQKSKDEFWKCLKEECTLNSEQAFWADMLLKGETLTSVTSLYVSDCELRHMIVGNLEQPLVQCTFVNVKFVGCCFEERGLNHCYFISCEFEDCNSMNEKNPLDYMTCEFYNSKSWVKGYLDAEIQQQDDSNEFKEENLEVQILRKYLKVDNRTRRMKMISKVREDFKDCPKEFHKCFERLISSGRLLCNGDKSFLTDEGFGYITESLSK